MMRFSSSAVSLVSRGSTSPREGSRVKRPSGGSAAGDLQKIGDRLRMSLLVQLHQLDAVRPVLDGHVVARLDQNARNIAVLAVDVHVAMRHQLRGRRPETARSQDGARRCRGAARGCSAALRRCFPSSARPIRNSGGTGAQQAIKAFELLLFPQAHAIFAELAAAIVHAGGRVAPFDGALRGIAPASLEIKLDAFTPAHLANGINGSGHIRFLINSGHV